MGMPNSKFGEEIPNNDLQEASVPSTPILAPKTIRLSDLDPRSPSLNIARTPFELLSAAADKLEELNETPDRKFVLGIDPRSPTTDFKRTPIFITSSDTEFPRKLLNKNLDKIRKLELHTSPVQSAEKIKFSPKPPKLLESSPVKQKTNAYKRRSLAGLLETNIDYTETDLDLILQEKYKLKNTDEGEVKGNIQLKENYEACNQDEDGNLEIKVPSINNEDMTLVENKNENSFEESETKAIIDRQTNNHQDVEKTEHLNIAETDSEASSTEIPNQTHSAPVTPPQIAISPILPHKEVKSAPVTPPLVDLTADVKELDKKLTNLIYEDDLVVCPRIIMLKENIERSPLRNCGNEPRVKSAQKLKVSDRPRKSDYTVSKIPIFKDKIKRNVQCENTPPRNIEKKIKPRKTDWDSKDNTLYL